MSTPPPEVPGDDPATHAFPPPGGSPASGSPFPPSGGYPASGSPFPPPGGYPASASPFPPSSPFAAGEPLITGPGEELPRAVLVAAASANLRNLLSVHAADRDPNRLILAPAFFAVCAVIGFADPFGDNWRIDFLPAHAVLFVVGLASSLMVVASLASNPYLNPIAAKRRLYLYEGGLVFFTGARVEVFRWEEIAEVKRTMVNSRRRSTSSWRVTRADRKRVNITSFYVGHDALGAEVNRRWQAARNGGGVPGAVPGWPVS